MVTSYRAHGRWGDIIVATVPVFWCLNILSHSTLLLRMSEFQTETNIITIRVRGRQWYWVYKLELANFFSLANKKILLNKDRHLNLASNFRGGSVHLFLRHLDYRQYWRNWFLNKSVWFQNFKGIDGELVTSETNLNDLDTNKKTMDWASKTHRIKSSWYARALDSNTTVLSVLDSQAAYPLSKLQTFFKNRLVFQNTRNLPNKVGADFSAYTTSLQSNTANVISNSHISDLNTKNILPTVLHGGYSTNTHSFINIDYSANSFIQTKLSEVNAHTSLGKNTLVYGLMNLHTLHTLNHSDSKNLVEFYKSTSNYYAPSAKSLSQLLNGNGKFKAALDPVRYTFELKARFGYNLHKLDLFTPISEEAKTGEKLPLMLLKEYSEYDLKDMNTITRYFMVFDQNRRQALRMYKPVKEEFVNRNSKFDVLNGLSDTVIIEKFKTILKSNSFCAYPIFNEKGEPEDVKGVSPIHTNRIILNSNTFINSNYQYDTVLNSLDYDSPKKYNMTTEDNVPQTNIRSKKKLLFNQRLLHTTSTLVLPTKLNITVITNSYDVIHSWFIPGLGLKMDCVPGRSTHHTLFIDQPGLYYGQCAEICGRFHHHMPIKVAALQWEHFLLWWYHYSMNLGVHGYIKDYNRTSVKEFKTSKVYPVTTKFAKQRPVM